MASETAIETVNLLTLKQDVTRGVLERLGVRVEPAPAVSRGKARLGSGPVIVEGQAVTGKRIQEALSAAFDERLGAMGQLFFLSAGGDLSPVITKVIAQAPQAVRARRDAFTEAHLDALVDVYLAHDPLAGPLAEIERDNAEAQARFIETVTCYSAEEVAALAGHAASNRSATTTRWKSQGAIVTPRSSSRMAARARSSARRSRLCRRA